MESTEYTRAERKARFRYERARVVRGLLGLAPLLLVIVLACSASHHPLATGVLGIAAFFAGVAMLWYGRGAQRAVLTGVAAGLVPLAFALCSSRMHGCMGDGCMSLCVPACIAGGAAAGLVVVTAGIHLRAGALFWVSASALALLVGSAGCACVGYTGIVGLAVGYAAVIVLVLLMRRMRSHVS